MNRKMNELLQGIDTVIVRVRDVDAAKQWYTTNLALNCMWEDTNMKLVVLDTNSPTSITLWQTDSAIRIDKSTASYPIFRSPDVAALKQLLDSRNVVTEEIIEDAHVLYFFFFDADGNVLEACQPKV